MRKETIIETLQVAAPLALLIPNLTVGILIMALCYVPWVLNKLFSKNKRDEKKETPECPKPEPTQNQKN